MYDDQLIEEMAQPILESLLELQEQAQGSELLDPPIIKLYGEGPILYADGQTSLEEDFLKRLEAYIQEQIDMWYRPTILH